MVYVRIILVDSDTLIFSISNIVLSVCCVIFNMLTVLNLVIFLFTIVISYFTFILLITYIQLNIVLMSFSCPLVFPPHVLPLHISLWTLPQPYIFYTFPTSH